MAVSSSVTSFADKQKVRAIIASHLKAYFAGTLATETDIENILMGFVQRESSFRSNIQGGVVSPANSSLARTISQSPPIVKIATSGTSQQKANNNGLYRAWGLMGCMGWNLIKGAGKNGGPTEIQKGRPDLAAILMMEPGEDLATKYSGDATISNQILAGMAMVESKWKIVKGSGNVWTVGSFTFSSRILASAAAYLGLGAKDVVTGITPEAYARSVVFGSMYNQANNTTAKITPQVVSAVSNPTQQQTATSGPIKTAASGENRHPPGC